MTRLAEGDAGERQRPALRAPERSAASAPEGTRGALTSNSESKAPRVSAPASRPSSSMPPFTAPRTPAAGRIEPAELLYGRLLASVAAGVEPGDARVRIADGRALKLPLARWLAPVDAADRAVLAHAVAPVLDIGCGPGRHLAALAAAGQAGLGLDLSPVAVRLARARGAEAIMRSVFADVPRDGTWRTALLLDGNIGIGGAPEALLARARALVAPGGAVLVETGPPDAPTRRVRVRLETPGAVSPWFGWATVGARGIGPLARVAGLRPRETFSAGGRWFARLERAP
jgi:SAM-dependent methyltransferase